MARNDLFDVFFATWVVLGLSSGAFFHFSKNAELKRRIWAPFVVGVGLLFTAFSWALVSPSAESGLVLVAVVALITGLNIRGTKFCDSCGKSVFASNPFSPMRFCPQCGATLK
jgi:apolipoprotein N-acyltransferase